MIVLHSALPKIKAKYFVPYGKYAQAEIDLLIRLRASVLSLKQPHRHVPLPIQWQRMSLLILEEHDAEHRDEKQPCDLFTDLIRESVIRAWKRLVTEYWIPSLPLIHLSYQENLSVFNLWKIGVRSLKQFQAILQYVGQELISNVAQRGMPIGALVSQDFCAPMSQIT